MSWNISVSAMKKDIDQRIEEEIEKYAAVDYCDGQLKAIQPFVETVTEGIDDNLMVSVTSAGGDMQNLPTRMAHTISVTVH